MISKIAGTLPFVGKYLLPRTRSGFRFPLRCPVGVNIGVILFSIFFCDVCNATPPADVCEAIPGDAVAQAAGGRLVETKTALDRCVYIVQIKDANPTGRAFVIYRHPESDFQGLMDATEGQIKRLEGIGDGAVLSFDPESQRYWLLVVKKGLATFQISGDDQVVIRRIAVTALKEYADR